MERATERVAFGQSGNSRIAARGMFLVAAELCRHGFNVTPTSRNMAGADLLITDDRCRNTWTIQVKVTDQDCEAATKTTDDLLNKLCLARRFRTHMMSGPDTSHA